MSFYLHFLREHVERSAWMHSTEDWTVYEIWRVMFDDPTKAQAVRTLRVNEQDIMARLNMTCDKGVILTKVKGSGTEDTYAAHLFDFRTPKTEEAAFQDSQVFITDPSLKDVSNSQHHLTAMQQLTCFIVYKSSHQSFLTPNRRISIQIPNIPPTPNPHHGKKRPKPRRTNMDDPNRSPDRKPHINLLLPPRMVF